MKVAIANETSVWSSNVGCQLVGQVLREQLKRVNMELILSLPKQFDIADYHDRLRKADLVIVNGEGSIHHGRHAHLIEIAKKYPSVLINCVYQENPVYESLKHFLLISARESISASYLREHGVDCRVVPDVIFASSFVRSFPRSPATRDIGVTDNARVTFRNFPFVKIKAGSDIKGRGSTPGRFLQHLSSFRRVCAGRFHSAALCALLEIPFSTWDAKTWKLRGMMKDMGVPHLHFRERKEALENVPDRFDPVIRNYVENARKQIESNFDLIAQIAAS